MAGVFSTVKSSELLIQQGEMVIHKTISKIERLKADSNFYRFYFKGEDSPSFILREKNKNGEEEDRFIHYCEKNSKKMSCSHIKIAFAIGKRVGLNPQRVLFKSNPAILNSYDKYKDEEYECLNGLAPFEDLVTLTTTQTKTSTVPKAKAVKSSSPKTVAPTKRNWATDWDDIFDYLNDTLKLSNRIIEEIKQKRIRIFNSVAMLSECLAPEKPETPYIGPMFERAMRWILMGKNILLDGPKGSGKDTLNNTIAWVLGAQRLIIGGNKDEDKDSLVGETGFKNDETQFEPAAFTKSVANGAQIHFSEFNMMEPDVLSLLNTVCDKNRILPTKAGSVKVHDETLIIGSMNTGDGYEGIKALNDATRDRFVVLDMPQGDFRSIIEGATGLTDTDILEWFEGIRGAIKSLNKTGQAHAADTIRGYIDAAELLQKYGTYPEMKIIALEDCILNKIQDKEQKIVARLTIRDLSRWNSLWEYHLPKTQEEIDYEGGY